MEIELVGAIKVKDGLFFGDEFAAEDLEFVVANKTTRIINCSARQVPNHWEPIGVNYLSFYWFDTDNQILFEGKEDHLTTIFNFIETSLQEGESVLVHSVRGKSRCVVVVATYFMKKYKWSLFKTLEFLNTRKPDMEVRQNFLEQLAAVENRIITMGEGPLSTTWNEFDPSNKEEMLVHHTFINAENAVQANYEESTERKLEERLRWYDENTGDLSRLVDVEHHSSKNPIENGFAVIRSCIKGNGLEENKVPIYQRPPFPVERNKVTNIGKNYNKKETKEAYEDIEKLAEELEFSRIAPSRNKTSKTRKVQAPYSTLKPNEERRPSRGKRPVSPGNNKTTPTKRFRKSRQE